MLLLNQIVQVLRRPDLRALRQQAIGLHFTHRPVRSSVTIERDRLRRLALMFDRLSEKGLVRAHVALCPEHEDHRLTGSIHRPVQINPFATNLVSRPGELHPEPLAEPYVRLAPHTAPVIQPLLPVLASSETAESIYSSSC
jgi:hypothetical protein